MPCVAGSRHSGDRHPPRKPVYDVVRRGPRDAGLTLDDGDGGVASNDRYDGRAISVVTVSGPVGGVDRDILCTRPPASTPSS